MGLYALRVSGVTEMLWKRFVAMAKERSKRRKTK